jgi:hypothetical protein
MEGLVRVGGRIKRANVPFHVKHPVILPRKGYTTSLLIQHYHQRVNHEGCGITLNVIREDWFWIIGASSAVAHHITKCVSSIVGGFRPPFVGCRMGPLHYICKFLLCKVAASLYMQAITTQGGHIIIYVGNSYARDRIIIYVGNYYARDRIIIYAGNYYAREPHHYICW